MTISEAIANLDQLKPNQYTISQKVAWLSNLDGVIFAEVISTHEGGAASFGGYDDSTDIDTELLVPFPYDRDIYTHYLQAQIDKENEEDSKYNQNITLYNYDYDRYAKWYNRTHAPKSAGSRFKF